MSLSCSCSDPDEWDWWWFPPDDYQIFQARRRKRCKSCGTLIEQGALCIAFPRRRPSTEMEEQIWGYSDGIEIATWYHCERCADLYFSLEELGFCVSQEDDMRELVKEYAALRQEKVL